MPVGSYVHVDFELRGCPINKRQLLEVLNAFLNRRKPTIPTHSVCVECKLRGNVCVMVARETPCLGPVTQAGCGGDLPLVRPRLLRLLRPDGEPEHRPRSPRISSELGQSPAGYHAGVPRIQCLRRSVPERERRP